MIEYRYIVQAIIPFSEEEVDLIFDSAQDCNIEISYLTLEDGILYNWKKAKKNGQEFFEIEGFLIDKIRNGLNYTTLTNKYSKEFINATRKKINEIYKSLQLQIDYINTITK